ncbi:DNA binding domain-containing protein, excisionase family [Methylomagnum ishizawai]|uniref:DNA binding domain-containing protein, excisionase family n=1 Tax=Methylomagnum ishizawai TaxID=1760988 RepID=A0A1Y6D5P9_9GAMM|nr:helix-turn-helix domain-containing protein [Methylomagnum ishizawai]SMF95872.1 DNA binding domain-containing protein, excisionase family [Methylomagnum ishizawai]
MSIPAPRKSALIQGTGIANADPLLTIPEAAAYLNIQPQTLNNWRATGRYTLPAVKVGRLVRIKKSTLDAFIASRTEVAA